MNNIVYVIQNQKNGQFIGNYKVSLWDQKEDLAEAHFFTTEKGARTQRSRLQNKVNEMRQVRDADPDKFHLEYQHSLIRRNVDDQLEVKPVTLTL
jgi:hypothetical protein